MNNLMRSVAFKAPGQISDLFVSSSTPVPTLKPDECLVKVVYSALNRADMNQRRGNYPPPPGASDILGLEAVGRIVKCSDNEDSNTKRSSSSNSSTFSSWKIGDRVMCLLAGGGQAEFVAVNRLNMIRIPESMTFRQAACIPEAWLTAFQLLYWISDFTKSNNRDYSNKSVLVHAGASGVGTSLIQMLTRLLKVGAVFATVGSDDKKRYLESHLNVTEAINYRVDADFTNKILATTKQRGVDLIFDCVGSQYWEKNLDCLALDSEWVLYGLMGGGKVDGDLLAKMMKKRASLKATTLRARSVQYKHDLMVHFERVILPHFQSGLLESIVDSEFSLDQIQEAHKRMESNENVGKILLKISDDEENATFNAKTDL